MKARGRAFQPGTLQIDRDDDHRHGTTTENGSHALWWAAGIALSHGQERLAEILETRARREEHLEEYDRIRSIPLKPIKLPPVPGRWTRSLGITSGGATTEMSESLYGGSPKRNSDTRTCGVLRFGRKNGESTFVYRVKCGQRTCAECRPKVIAAKVDPLPDEMYALEVEREAWPTLDRKLRRWRAAGKVGDYARIPLDGTRLLIVSNAKIGNPIKRASVESFMLEAESRDGQITASKAWQPAHAGSETPDTVSAVSFVDEGRVTASPEWMIRKARRLGIPPDIDAGMATFDFGPTTDEEHDQLRLAFGVETDAEFWSRTNPRRPRGAAIARMSLARAA